MRIRTVITLLALAAWVPWLPVPGGALLGPTLALADTELHFLSVARGEPRRQAILETIA